MSTSETTFLRSLTIYASIRFLHADARGRARPIFEGETTEQVYLLGKQRVYYNVLIIEDSANQENQG